MKGKNQRLQEQSELRNLATICNECKFGFEREFGLTEHMEAVHRKDGFICTECKRGDVMKYKARHGAGVCEKVQNLKKKKATKQEKKKMKMEARAVCGFLDD